MMGILKKISLNPFRPKQTKADDVEVVVPVEFDRRDKEIFEYILENNLTAVGPLRLIATINACKYILQNGIDGDFVECGVWRGGNALAAKLIFERYQSDKHVILFDTFAGMTKPTDIDKKTGNIALAEEKYLRHQKGDINRWCYASMEDVENNFKDANVAMEGVQFIKGDVLETLLVAENLPKKIAVLRLDTDWYESTKQELETLYPLLVTEGVLLVDDYGSWEGARKAVDEYFEGHPTYKRPLLQYTDHTGRMGIKC